MSANLNCEVRAALDPGPDLKRPRAVGQLGRGHDEPFGMGIRGLVVPSVRARRPLPDTRLHQHSPK